MIKFSFISQYSTGNSFTANLVNFAACVLLYSYCVHSYPQTKRDEPSNVVDYEKIDNDARVSRALLTEEIQLIHSQSQNIYSTCLK